MMDKGSASNLTLKEVLREAIHKEIEAHLLYAGLKNRVNDSSAKEALQDLSDQESIHQHVLEDYLGGVLKEGILNVGMVVDYKIAEYLDQPQVSPSMELKDVFFFWPPIKKKPLMNYICSWRLSTPTDTLDTCWKNWLPRS